MSTKESKTSVCLSPTSLMEKSMKIEGKDVPFGPPPTEYNYRCSQCDCEMLVNEAIIDVEVGIAEFEGRWYEGFMPVLGCPGCNRETMQYAED